MLQQDYAATHPFYQKSRNCNFWTYHDCALSTRYVRIDDGAENCVKLSVVVTGCVPVVVDGELVSMG